MIRNVLTHIGGVELYGIVSIVLFFAFFLGMLVWAFRLSRRHLDAMARLPLEEAPPETCPGAPAAGIPSTDHASRHAHE